MPELPEVESVRRSLLPLLRRRRIETVRVLETRLRRPVDGPALARTLPGRRITDLRRRGKYLLMDLSYGDLLLLHLGMSGRLRIARPADPLAVHDHLILGLGGGRELRFNDTRRFGLVLLVPPGGESGHPLLQHLGLEPFCDSFRPERLRAGASGRRAPIKNFIMDAKRVAGIGNIYACESLHAAGLHPRRPAGRISLASWGRLTGAIRQVLAAAIDDGGTTLRDFRNGRDEPGFFGPRLEVYGRETAPCRRCRRPIRRIVLAGRSTFYCPGCQH
ncbi:MAG: bifunctional DNA-formamidopyrimidine glycosylase/DNA-(apurinic or apyrimidinic site) lyase [Acidobacteriota bacterium]